MCIDIAYVKHGIPSRSCPNSKYRRQASDGHLSPIQINCQGVLAGAYDLACRLVASCGQVRICDSTGVYQLQKGQVSKGPSVRFLFFLLE